MKLGWSIGGTNTGFYNGKYLAYTEDVVVVTVNFRLNIFGYPGVPGASQNLGMQDQRMAVEWVRDNIAAFSGDASRITIFGQSSGALAADFWSYAYKKDPIVAGIISHSGNAYSFPLNTLELAEKNWYNASAQVGCGSSGDNLGCMREVDWNDIRVAAAKVPPPPGTSQARSQPPFQATIDEIRVFSNYYERAETGNHAKIVNDHLNYPFSVTRTKPITAIPGRPQSL
jgi:cholinesterase